MQFHGDKFPTFRCKAVVDRDPAQELAGFIDGQWQGYLLWPRDFTFVCPMQTEELCPRNGREGEQMLTAA